MKQIITLSLVAFFTLSTPKAMACDGHGHSNTYTWHTMSIAPILEEIAERKATPEQVYTTLVNHFIADHIPLQETFEKLGHDGQEYKSFAAMYKEQTKKSQLPVDATMEEFIVKLKDIRGTKKYAAHCAGQMYDLYNYILENDFSQDKQDLMMATLQVYIESAHFWDYQNNFFDLSPKAAAAPVKYEFFESEVFYRTFMGMQELGFGSDEAHIIASFETAYQSALCRNCGMWWEM